MKSFLKIVRWFFSILLCLVLFITIITSITATSISTTVTNPKSLKTWLSQGSVYDKTPTIASSMIKSQSEKEGPEQMPMSQEQLTEISRAVLEPNWLKTNIETVIDSVYVWLRGETQIPTFQIDIAERKEIIINQLSQQAPAQMRSQINQQIRNQIEQNEILKKDTINSPDLIRINKEDVEKVQTVYGHIERAPLYALGLFLFISLLLFLLVTKLPKKLFIVGLVWTATSLILVVSQPVLKRFLRNLYTAKIKSAEIANANLVLEIVNQPINLAINDLSSKILIYGGVLITAGLVLLFTSYKIKPASEKEK